MALDPSTRRRRATIGIVAFAAVGIVLLLVKAEGRLSAYVAFGVVFVVSLVVAALLERHLHLSRRPRRGSFAAIGLAAALAMLVSALGIPFIETGVAGAATGALVGLGSMIIAETSKAIVSRGIGGLDELESLWPGAGEVALAAVSTLTASGLIANAGIGTFGGMTSGNRRRSDGGSSRNSGRRLEG